MPKQQLVPLHTTDAADATRDVVQQINAALGVAASKIPDMVTADVALLLLAADDINRNLASLRHDAQQQLIKLAPVDTYRYKGEVRTRPAKEQIVENVGVVMIEQAQNRTWKNLRELAHEILNRKARENEGEYPTARQTLELIFDIFAVGGPRVTALRERGWDDLDSEDWCDTAPKPTARVMP